MRKLKLLGLAVMALFAFGAFAASGAYAVEAEEENNPRILCLTGVNCEELKATLKSAAGSIPSLIGLKSTIEATAAEIKVENCETVSGHPADINLCKDVVAGFTGVTSAGVNCRSETAGGVKDAIGTVLALLDLHQAAGTVGGALAPIITAHILGAALEAEVKIVCGLVKIKVEGVLACEMSPGLAVISTAGVIKIVCKTNATTKDPEIPTCTVLCEDFGKPGVTATFGAATEDAWEKITLEGSPSKDIFIDD